MWSGCTNRCCTPSINWNKPCACLRPRPLAGPAPPARVPGGRVVEIRYRQSPQDAELFAQTLLALPVESWWEDWMRHADRLLDDPEMVNIVHQVLLKRRPQSRTRGRLSTPAEVVLRLMVLKHVRNWSYGVLAREVRANLVYRQFTRLGHHRMPHAKTLGKLGLLLGPNSAGKIVSLFEHTSEIIRKGKPGKPTEFGKMIKVQEAENQIIVAYEVYDKRPADSASLVPAIEQHQQRLGVTPRVVAGDAGFCSAANETAAQKMGVAQVAVPSFGTKSAQRRKRQKERWFRKAQKWRIGCEGRISVLKRRHGLRRCLYKGDAGMHRWVGLGVIADNLINIGRVLNARLTPKKSASDAP